MKFVCDRCNKRFSSVDEPMPGRVYRIRCKCGNLIQITAPHADAGSARRKADPLHHLDGASSAMAPLPRVTRVGTPAGDAGSPIAAAGRTSTAAVLRPESVRPAGLSPPGFGTAEHHARATKHSAVTVPSFPAPTQTAVPTARSYGTTLTGSTRIPLPMPDTSSPGATSTAAADRNPFKPEDVPAEPSRPAEDPFAAARAQPRRDTPFGTGPSFAAPAAAQQAQSPSSFPPLGEALFPPTSSLPTPSAPFQRPSGATVPLPGVRSPTLGVPALRPQSPDPAAPPEEEASVDLSTSEQYPLPPPKKRLLLRMALGGLLGVVVLGAGGAYLRVRGGGDLFGVAAPVSVANPIAPAAETRAPPPPSAAPPTPVAPSAATPAPAADDAAKEAAAVAARAEADRRAEEQRAEEQRGAEEKRAEEKRAEEKRAEEKRAEEKRSQQERRAESAQQSRSDRRAEKERLAEERRVEKERQAEKKRLEAEERAEAAKQAADKRRGDAERRAEEKRLAQERRRAEADRKAAERAEAARRADEARRAEADRKTAEKLQATLRADQERERKAAEQREAERRAEEQRRREASAKQAAVSEGLDPGEMQAVIGRNRGALDGCVEKALQDPATSSYAGRKAYLILLVSPNGKAEAALEDPDLDGSAFGACLRRAAGRMTFPAFKGESVGARIPLVLGR